MIPCDTCDCVGIRSIVNNSNGTTTVTLTNGRATTYQSKGDTGATGPAGPTGPAGAAGVSILYNNFSDATNGSTTGVYVILDTYTIPANTMANDGDVITAYGVFKNVDEAATGTAGKISLNAVFMGLAQLVNGVIYGFVNIVITRTGATSALFELTESYTDGVNTLVQRQYAPAALSPVDWGADMVINAQMTSNSASSAQLNAFRITYYPKS